MLPDGTSGSFSHMLYLPQSLSWAASVWHIPLKEKHEQVRECKEVQHFPVSGQENSWEAAEPARGHSIRLLSTGKPRSWEMIYTAMQKYCISTLIENIRMGRKTFRPLTCYWGKGLSNSERPKILAVFSMFNSYLQNTKALWVDSAYRNKQSLQGTNKAFLFFQSPFS